MERLGGTEAGHNMIMLFYLNVNVPEHNYQEKAAAACVPDCRDCTEGTACILSVI